MITRLRRINDGGHYILPEVIITETSGNWLRISTAYAGIGGEVTFNGSGWVHNSRTATTTRGYRTGHVVLRQWRRTTSTPIMRVKRETEVGIRGCRNRWALVAHKKMRGWLAPKDQCGTNATTCN